MFLFLLYFQISPFIKYILLFPVDLGSSLDDFVFHLFTFNPWFPFLIPFLFEYLIHLCLEISLSIESFSSTHS